MKRVYCLLARTLQVDTSPKAQYDKQTLLLARLAHCHFEPFFLVILSVSEISTL